MALTKIHTLACTSASLALVALLAGCASAPAPFPGAIAKLEPTKGNTAQGTVRFMQLGSKVAVAGEISGLKPGAVHGFHIHEKGDCSAPDGMSAGGHYNPTGHQHGKAGPAAHVGDLPSLVADSNGVARLNWETRSLSAGTGLPTDVKGRGVIVHKDKDDFITQPTGNSGARLACGVIN